MENNILENYQEFSKDNDINNNKINQNHYEENKCKLK